MKKKRKEMTKEEKKKEDTKNKNQGSKGFVMSPSKCSSIIDKACLEYKAFWRNFNDSRDRLQRHDDELIRQQFLPEVKEDIRLQVDSIMRAELELLHRALAKDKKKKYKKKKIKKKRKKPKKRKKMKDLTPYRSMMSLFSELVERDIIKKYSPASLDDFLGDYNYIGTSLSRQGVEPIWHCPADVKHIALQYCILPLSNHAVHIFAPLIKSILFVGPPGVGKNTLVRAICTESQSLVFDLSAANIAGKYPGKAGLKMLMHLVEKVGKELQPSIIVIHNVEKMFMRKVPKTDKTEPKRLRKELPKFIKRLKYTDRILVIGISDKPFAATDMKGLNATFKKIIYVPHPEFNSRQILWENFIRQEKCEITPKLNITTLAKVSDGYTGKQIKQIVNEVLTKRRVAFIKEVPITVDDFICSLSRHMPLYKNEIMAYQTWFCKTTLAKKRRKLLMPTNTKTTNKNKKKKK